MTPETVLVEIEQSVGTVTLNRPTARNAISGELLARLRQVLSDLDRDPDVAVVVLTGADPAFCAGLDLKELATNGGRLAPTAGAAAAEANGTGGTSGAVDPTDGAPEGHPWAPLSKPIIGAINGVAITGGLEFALNCNFLVASERALFADTHARVGIMPGWGLSVLLPELVGFAMARRMSFTGDFIDAATALRAGLVTEVVAHEELVPHARRLAATIAANDRAAVGTLHRSYRLIEAESTGRGREREAETSRAYHGASGGKGRDGGTGMADRAKEVIERGRQQVRGNRAR